MISYGGFGTSCPAQFVFITVKPDRSVSYTESFGTCSDSPEISLLNDEVSVTMDDWSGAGDVTWKFSNGVLTKTVDIDSKSVKNAPRLIFNEDEPVTVKGSLTRSADGAGWELKLPKKTLLNGGNGDCQRLKDSLTIKSNISIPDAQGDTEFKVKILCPESGALITEIKTSGDEWKPAYGAAANRHYNDTSNSSGDAVAAYANNIASQLEKSSYPGCSVLAANIRSFGNSSMPDYIRQRQVDALLDKAPDICLQ